jgi:TP901 family phage tail tape measure protein
MSDTAIIKEFLVSLGFKIDADSEKKFSNTLAAVTLKAVELGAAVTGAATLVVAGVAKIADGLEQLYFSSERTHATVENIQALGFAARQMGGSVEGAVGSLENMARLLRNSPGGEGLLKNIGIQTRDANGELRDTAEMLQDLGKKFADMPYYKANAYAQALGIDERTLMAMRKGMGEFGEEYKGMLHAAGLNSQEAAKNSHAFLNQLRLLQGAATILVQKISSEMTGKMAENVRHLREMFIGNFQHIVDVITKVLGFVFRLADAVSILAMRGINALGKLIDWFNGLSDGSKNVIKWLGLILVAWRVLNAGFLATPLGQITALIGALALLWDDYKVWKSGGKSLIDWTAWSPAIEAAIGGIERIGKSIHSLLGFAGDFRPALEILLAYVAGSWALGMIGAFTKVSVSIGARLTGALTGLLGNAGLVAAAGALGYGIGTLINDKLITGTKFGDSIGKAITHTLAFFGDKDAQATLDLVEKNKAKEAAQVGVDAAHVVPNVPVDQRVKPNIDAPNLHGDKATLRTEAARQMAEARRVAGLSPESPTTPSGEGSWGTERGLRNNNPGNIEYTGNFAKSHGATGVEDGPEQRFAKFATAQDGLNALADLLRTYLAHGTDSVRKMIARYAPKKENQTEAYIANVAKKLGVDPDQKLNLDPAQMSGMIDAIVRVENGKNPYSSEMIARASTPGQNTASGQNGKDVTVSQVTHITVTGATDPKTTARDISTAQNNVNEQLTRNMRGAVLQ